MIKKSILTFSCMATVFVALSMTTPIAQRLVQKEDATKTALTVAASDAYAALGEGFTCKSTPLTSGLQTSLAPSKVARVNEADQNLELIFKEDFSKFAEGSEEEIDADELTNFGEQIFIDEEYTDLPGWWGLGVYQAGGNCALAYPGVGGYITTPNMNLFGKIVIKLRAKSVSGDATLIVDVLKGDIHFPEAIAITPVVFESDNGWTDYECTVENVYKGEDCYVQLQAMTYHNGLLIDYIEIWRDNNYLERPVQTDATNFTQTGFTASWNKVEVADKYLVSVYEDTPTGEAPLCVDEDFDNINLENPVFPENWDINMGDIAVACFSPESSPALHFATNSDYVILPSNGGRVTNLSFTLRRGENMSSSSMGGIMVNGLEDEFDEEWNSIASFYAAMIGDNEVEVDLSEAIAGRFSTIRIIPFQLEDGDEIFLDNLKYAADLPVEKTCIREDIEVMGTTIRVEDLVPEYDYYFSVKSVSGEKVSDSSPLHRAFGIAAPVVIEASDIDPEGAFTANWQPVPKATSYLIDLYAAVVVTEPKDDYVVLEEDFSKVNSTGTVENPEVIGGLNYMSLDDLTQLQGWFGSGVIVADGMLGCREMNGYDVELCTPLISLHNNEGNYTVQLSVYGHEGDTFVVQGFKGLAYHKFETTGLHELVFDIPEGIAKDRLMMYVANNTSFLIDSIRVTQNLEAGNHLLTYMESGKTDGPDTFAGVVGLDSESGIKYAYTVSSIYKKYGESCQSDLSEVAIVELNPTEVTQVSLEEQVVELSTNGLNLMVRTSMPTSSAVYTLNGIIVANINRTVNEVTYTLPSTGIYIIKVGEKSFKVNVK